MLSPKHRRKLLPFTHVTSSYKRSILTDAFEEYCRENAIQLQSPEYEGADADPVSKRTSHCAASQEGCCCGHPKRSVATAAKTVSFCSVLPGYAESYVGGHRLKGPLPRKSALCLGRATDPSQGTPGPWCRSKRPGAIAASMILTACRSPRIAPQRCASAYAIGAFATQPSLIAARSLFMRTAVVLFVLVALIFLAFTPNWYPTLTKRNTPIGARQRRARSNKKPGR